MSEEGRENICLFIGFSCDVFQDLFSLSLSYLTFISNLKCFHNSDSELGSELGSVTHKQLRKS